MAPRQLASYTPSAVDLLSSPRREKMTRPHALWYKDQMSCPARRRCGYALLSLLSLAHAEPQAWKIGSPLIMKSHASFKG